MWGDGWGVQYIYVRACVRVCVCVGGSLLVTPLAQRNTRQV